MVPVVAVVRTRTAVMGNRAILSVVVAVASVVVAVASAVVAVVVLRKYWRSTTSPMTNTRVDLGSIGWSARIV
jgi:hypothetical protein